jgi:hypothetical protein
VEKSQFLVIPSEAKDPLVAKFQEKANSSLLDSVRNGQNESFPTGCEAVPSQRTGVITQTQRALRRIQAQADAIYECLLTGTFASSLFGG